MPAFKLTLVLLLVIFAVVDVEGWWGRRRTSRRRRKWAGVAKWAGHVAKWLTKWDNVKMIRDRSEKGYQDLLELITSEIREDEGDEAAQFAAEVLDQISSNNPEPVSGEMKKKIQLFMDAVEQARQDSEVGKEEFDSDINK